MLLEILTHKLAMIMALDRISLENSTVSDNYSHMDECWNCAVNTSCA